MNKLITELQKLKFKAVKKTAISENQQFDFLQKIALKDFQSKKNQND